VDIGDIVLTEMDIIGAHARVLGGRFLVGLVFGHDRNVVEERSFGAPAGAPESRQLDELHRFVVDMLRRTSAEHLALRVAEVRGQKPARVAARAEGALMAAAGFCGVPTRSWFGAGLWRPAGLAASSTMRARTDALCASLSGLQSAEAEIRAAAAALAATVATAP
jgi:hypothetical protein